MSSRAPSEAGASLTWPMPLEKFRERMSTQLRYPEPLVTLREDACMTIQYAVKAPFVVDNVAPENPIRSDGTAYQADE